MALQSPRPRILVCFIKLDDAYWQAAGRDMLLPDLGFGSPAGERRGGYQPQDRRRPPARHARLDAAPPGPAAAEERAAARPGRPRHLRSSSSRRWPGGSSPPPARSRLREAAAQHLANHDALTGLPNRRLLETELVAFAEAAERDGARLAIACVDVDRFKDINDTLGHHAGDQLIRGLADRLRASDARGRFRRPPGRRRVRGRAQLPRRCRRRRRCWRRCATASATPFRVTGHLVEANASVGIAFAEAGRSFEDLMREADIALYEAKASGRGCDVRFEASMGAEDREAPHARGRPQDRDRAGRAFGPLPADRRGLDRPDQLGRGAVPLDQRAPRRGAARRLHPDRRGGRADGRSRPLRHRARGRRTACAGRSSTPRSTSRRRSCARSRSSRI